MKKLKNKEDGLVVIFVSLNLCDDEYVLRYKFNISSSVHEIRYDSLEKFKEEWEEEFSPISHTIRGEKNIEIFRAWAIYSGFHKFLYDAKKDCLIANFKESRDDFKLYFSFETIDATRNLEDKTIYTLNELLGDYED